MLDFIKKIIPLSLMLIAFLSIGNIVFAQESATNSMSSIYLNISPSNPRAGDSFVLTVSSDLLDLDSSKIVWYVDGVARKENANKSITIKLGRDGKITTIRVVVETSDGIIKETTKEITPGGVDLIVEAMSYSMPFYKGKPSFIPEGTVKIVAIPDITIDGVKILSKDLNFKWTKGDDILIANSGNGKDLIIVNSAIPVRDITVGVQILDDLGNILAENSKILVKKDPSILFYENSPLYGVLYNKAVTGNYYLGTKEELNITAKPFGFTFNNDTASESNYVWSVNNNNVAMDGKANELLMKQTSEGTKGTASILLNINNINKITQYASNGFNVEFGN